MTKNERPAAQDRTLSGLDFFLLWAGAAVALPEIWAGGLLLPLGLAAGMVAILAGHAIGGLPMTLAGVIGSRHGVPAIISTRGALGNRGSALPALLNITQLIGWTAVMLWIGGNAAAQLTGAGDAGRRLCVLGLGLLTTAWALAGHRLWKWLQRLAVAALLVLSVIMTRIILSEFGFQRLLEIQPSGGMPFGLGLDLVIAMPVSWLPLVSDYSRFAHNSRRCAVGTWAGYFLVSSWMYAAGLCAALATGSSSPDSMILQTMQARGLAFSAILIVLFSTFTTTFLDIYSNAVSLRSLFPRAPERLAVAGTGMVGTLLAILLPATQYESFLLFIGSAFCPLFGVVLMDYFVLRRGRYEAPDLLDRGRYWYAGGLNLRAMAAWAVGFAVYRLAVRLGWPIGASLPGMIAGALSHALLAPRKARAAR